METGACATCGDGVATGGEPCDGADVRGLSCGAIGFALGELSCGGCELDTSQCSLCGNGVREGGEACDGEDLGEESCASSGFEWGAISCDEGCAPATDACVPHEYNPAAVRFDGLDDIIDCGYMALGLPLGSHSLEAWILMEPNQGGGVVLQKWTLPPAPGESFHLFRYNGDGCAWPPGQPCVFVDQKLGPKTALGHGFPATAPGEWHHFGVTSELVDSGTALELAYYLDGTLLWPDTHGGLSGLQASSAPLLMGRGLDFDGLPWPFEGAIDEIRLWSYAREGYEIRDAARTTLSGTEPGLVAYWNFDEGAGDVAMDLVSGTLCQLGALSGPDAEDPLWTTETPF